MTITVADLKAHLNLTTDDDDDLLEGKIAAAADWIAGYTGIPVDASDMPSAVLEATRQLAAHLYENREATLIAVTAQELPFGFLTLLERYREWAF